MTTRSLSRAIKQKKPSVIHEAGRPRYVVLDWEAYRAWKDMQEDMEDHIRFEIAECESGGKERYTLSAIKKKYRLA